MVLTTSFKFYFAQSSIRKTLVHNINIKSISLLPEVILQYQLYTDTTRNLRHIQSTIGILSGTRTIVSRYMCT